MYILKATTERLHLVASLFDQYRQFYKQTADLKGATLFIAERMKNAESVIFIALTDEGEAAGFVQLYPSFSSVSMKRVWVLNDLFVSPHFRQQNVARQLMKVCDEFAQSDHAKGLTLMTAIDNHPAQKLYESLDWKKITQFYFYSKNFNY